MAKKKTTTVVNEKVNDQQPNIQNGCGLMRSTKRWLLINDNRTSLKASDRGATF